MVKILTPDGDVVKVRALVDDVTHPSYGTNTTPSR